MVNKQLIYFNTCFGWGGSKELIKIRGSHYPPVSFRQIGGHAQTANGFAVQGGDVVSDGRKHAPDLMVAAFMDDQTGLMV